MTAAPKHLKARGRKGEPEPKRKSSSLTTVGLYLKMPYPWWRAAEDFCKFSTANRSHGLCRPRWSRTAVKSLLWRNEEVVVPRFCCRKCWNLQRNAPPSVAVFTWMFVVILPDLAIRGWAFPISEDGNLTKYEDIYFWGWKSYHRYEEVEKSDFFQGKTRRTGMVKHFQCSTPPQMPPSFFGKYSGLLKGLWWPP